MLISWCTHALSLSLSLSPSLPLSPPPPFLSSPPPPNTHTHTHSTNTCIFDDGFVQWEEKDLSVRRKCRCQVTAKHTCTLLPMWLSVKWHCKLVHGCTVYTESVATKQHCKCTTSVDISFLKHAIKGYSHLFRIVRQECSESSPEQRIVLYENNQ